MASKTITNPNARHPLALPKGSVRSILALSVVGAFLVSHVTAAITLTVTGHTDLAMATLGLLAVEAGNVGAFYFAGRSAAS